MLIFKGSIFFGFYHIFLDAILYSKVPIFLEPIGYSKVPSFPAGLALLHACSGGRVEALEFILQERNLLSTSEALERYVDFK